MRRRRWFRFPGEARRDAAHAAVGDVDDRKPVHGLIEHLPRITCPRRGARKLRRESPWPAERRAVLADRQHGEMPVEDHGHLSAVGRPRGTEILAHADRLVRQRIEPRVLRRRAGARGLLRAQVDRHEQHLIGALAESRRVGTQCAHHHRAPAGQPARTTGLVQPIVRLARLPGGDVHDLQLRFGVEIGDARGIGRPGGGHGARGKPAIGAALHVANPQIHRAAAIRRERELRAIR